MHRSNINSKTGIAHTDMNVKDIIISNRHYDQFADGYLVAGKLKKSALKKTQSKKKLGKYVVAWHSRHNEKLVKPKYYMDKETAEKAFLEDASDDLYPYKGALKKDWQADDYYKWQYKFIWPHRKGITKKSATELIKQASNDYNITAPKFKMSKAQNLSKYDYKNNEIIMGHRDNIFLLHELAHAICDQKFGSKHGSSHGPAFVWTAIELFNRYADINTQYMIATAAKDGLLGDINENQLLSVEALPKQSQIDRWPD
jgi:hypothetical protein